MSFIKSRIRNIERTVRSANCPACKLPPNGPGRIAYGARPEGSAEFCARCGRRLWCVIEVVEDA